MRGSACVKFRDGAGNHGIQMCFATCVEYSGTISKKEKEIEIRKKRREEGM